RLEVLDRNGVMVADYALSPLAGRVPPLVRDFRIGFRGLPLGPLVPGGRLLAFLRLPADHLPLVMGQLDRGLLPALWMREIVSLAGGGGALLHAPVDAED